MIKIYTDGSCLENPGNGGWAAIINDNGNVKKISGNEKDTTTYPYASKNQIPPSSLINTSSTNNLLQQFEDVIDFW